MEDAIRKPKTTKYLLIMKHRFFLWALLAAFMGFAACSDDDEVVTPTPKPDPNPEPQPEVYDSTLKLPSDVVEVSHEEGEERLDFQIYAPKENNNVMYECSTEWISDVAVTLGKVHTDGEPMQEAVLTFKVAANTAAAREAKIVLSYNGAEDVTLTVRQAEYKEPEKPADVFSVEFKHVGKTDVVARITPNDLELPYFKFVMSASEMALYGDDQALIEAEMIFFNQQMQQFGMGLPEILNAFHRKGVTDEKCDTHYFSMLVPDNDYFVYVYALDMQTGALISPVTRAPFHTAKAEEVSVNFQFDYTINGSRVDMQITPEGFDGYYFTDVYTGVDENTPKDIVVESVKTTWMNMIQNYMMYGLTPEQIMAELAQKGQLKKTYELAPNEKWVIVAFALDPDALPASDVAMDFFATGDLVMSENVVKITASNITSHKATLTFEPSNDDTYTAAILTDEELQASGATSDRDIMKWCIQNVRMEGFNGKFETEMSALSASTKYHVFAFGCVAGEHITTPLFRTEFTTLEEVFIEADFSMIYENYYDLMEVVALAPQFESFVGQGEVIIPVAADVKTPDVIVMWSIFAAEEVDAVSEQTIVDALKAYGYQGASALLLYYNTAYKIVAMAVDAEGNRTKVWKSEPLTLVKSGTSPAQEFIDMLQPQAARLSRVNALSAARVENLMPRGKAFEAVEVARIEQSAKMGFGSYAAFDPAELGQQLVRKALMR